MNASLTALARRFSFVRETEGPNKGTWVNLFQRFTGNTLGDSWCCSFVCFLLDMAYHGKAPWKMSGACQAILTQAIYLKKVVTTPQVDDLFVYVDNTGHAHHIGVVTGLNPLTGIAGNTSEDGVSSNGTGVFEHEILVAPNHIRFIRP